eukprot:13851237-Alexandrium_andersonii.AAC.1
MADCGWGRIAALTGLAQIAGCTLALLRCKDASVGAMLSRFTIMWRFCRAVLGSAGSVPVVLGYVDRFASTDIP